MKNGTLLILLISFFFVSHVGLAQVDVVYNDLVWSDEFDSNGVIDANKWHHQTQIPSGGNWYNNEVQHYTNRITNSFVNSGFLKIVAKKEVFTDQGVTKQYTSARLNSKFAFKYGRIDIRAKVPIDGGTWPALWTLGKNINEDGGFFDSNYGTTNWPACGEIDIMEHGIFHSQPINYISAAIHTPSSNGNTFNKGGILASDLANSYHIYSMNWSPNQISFLLDGVIFYTYNPAIKDANTWPFDKEQYLLLNIAMGGYAGTIASNFTEATMDIDYVRVYQNTTPDTQLPTNFTASVGAITASSIELLLNATDDSGTIVYNVAYGVEPISTSFPSGTQKSIVITNLTPSTAYSFSVSASDLTGNFSLNSPMVINASTIENSNTVCSGTSSEASENAFTNGYNYTFQTIGTDVKITFELLDTDKTGVVAYLRRQGDVPSLEVSMSHVSGKTFTKTIMGQTLGTTISYAVKFAYAGGLSVTKFVSYVVGTNCTLGIESASELSYFEIFPNPSSDFINIVSIQPIDTVELYNLMGAKVFNSSINTSNIDITDLSAGIYMVVIYSGTKKSIQKIIVK